MAVSTLAELFPEFASGEWVLCGTEDHESAWAFHYNSREYLETGNVSDALAGNGPLVVPRNGERPWFAWSGADIATQVARGRSTL